MTVFRKLRKVRTKCSTASPSISVIGYSFPKRWHTFSDALEWCVEHRHDYAKLCELAYDGIVGKASIREVYAVTGKWLLDAPKLRGEWQAIP